MTHSHKVMHSCIHVIVTNCLLSCVLNSKDVTHLLLSSCEFNVCVCMCRWTRWAQSQWDCRESTLTKPIRSMPNRRKWSKTGNSSETRLVLSSVVAPASSVASPFQGLEDGGKESKGAVEVVGDDPLATAYMSGGGGGHESRGCDLQATCWRGS